VSGLFVLAVLTWAGTTAGIYTAVVKENAPRPALTIPLVGVQIPLPLPRADKIRVPMRERTDPELFVTAAFNLFCLGIAWAGLSTLASACDRYRWRTIGVVVAVYILMIIAKLLGQAFPEVTGLQWLSLFTPYEPQKFVSIAANDPGNAWALAMYDSQGQFLEPGPLGYSLLLAAVGISSYVAAGIVFHRRDLPAPL
jgi:ABC-2 type transport system permease protein